MQEPPSYATQRRVGCVMWLAIVAILLSGTNFAWNLVQELAWNERVEQATLVTTIVTPSMEVQEMPTEQATVASLVVIPPETTSAEPAPQAVAITSVPVVAEPTATTTSVPPPTATSAPTANGDLFRIGDNVVVGDIRWRVITVDDLGNRIASDNEFIDDAVTGGRFIRVLVEVDNRGSEPASYWEPEMLDERDRTFSRYSGASFAIPDEQDCIFLVVNPGLSKQCVHIYEVAADAQGLRLKVTDFALFLAEEALIDLR